jgi:hypothetical protein
MFYIGQRVIVTHPNHKVGQNSVGTVIGYYRYMVEDDDGEEMGWEDDHSEPLIKFDEDTIITTYGQDWDNQADERLPVGTLYIDYLVLEAFYEEGKLAHIRNSIHNRHNEYKERMLLRHRSR